MRFFKNPETKKTLVGMFLIGIILGVPALDAGWQYLFWVIVTIISCSVLVIISGEIRYRKISNITFLASKVLHGEDINIIGDNKEGELAILESEIGKMMIKIREASHLLQKEKVYLTDAIADISHQLKTPLTTINLQIASLKDENLSSKEHFIIIKATEKNLQRIDWLVKSLLKMAKIDAGTATFQKVNVSVRDLIKKAVDPILISMELREQTFKYEGQGQESFVGDMNWSVEAFGNILKNSMEHTQNGGCITVRCKENPIFTQIQIIDNGAGINKEDLPNIFKRFYKGKNSSNSSVGIGLALARTIIVEQNGSIRVENGKDSGAIFTIRFYKEMVI